MSEPVAVTSGRNAPLAPVDDGSDERPGTVVVDYHQYPTGGEWVITLRRADGSVRTVARGVANWQTGLRIADRLRTGIADAEPWALALVDVSAGELREDG